MEKAHKPFLMWWLFITLATLGLVIAGIFGVHENIINTGLINTVLCGSIFAIFIFQTMNAGRISFNIGKTVPRDLKKISSDVSDPVWFAANSCGKIGICGTIIGFIMMLGNFQNIDVSSVENMKSLIAALGAGLGVALYTTLCGIIFGHMLQVQAFMIDRSLRLSKDFV